MIKPHQNIETVLPHCEHWQIEKGSVREGYLVGCNLNSRWHVAHHNPRKLHRKGSRAKFLAALTVESILCGGQEGSAASDQTSQNLICSSATSVKWDVCTATVGPAAAVGSRSICLCTTRPLHHRKHRFVIVSSPLQHKGTQLSFTLPPCCCCWTFPVHTLIHFQNILGFRSNISRQWSISLEGNESELFAHKLEFTRVLLLCGAVKNPALLQPASCGFTVGASDGAIRGLSRPLPCLTSHLAADVWGVCVEDYKVNELCQVAFECTVFCSESLEGWGIKENITLILKSCSGHDGGRESRARGCSRWSGTFLSEEMCVLV